MLAEIQPTRGHGWREGSFPSTHTLYQLSKPGHRKEQSHWTENRLSFFEVFKTPQVGPHKKRRESVWGRSLGVGEELLWGRSFRMWEGPLCVRELQCAGGASVGRESVWEELLCVGGASVGSGVSVCG